MSSYRSVVVAAAVAFAVGCGGGVDRAPEARDGGGGADGFGDDARPTAAERTGATGDSNRGGGVGLAGLEAVDRQFVQQASLSNQAEVELGNLAEDKGERDEVKQFGEQLARDHEAANRELQSSLGGGDATTAQQPGGGVSNQPDRTGEAGVGGTELNQMRQQIANTQQKLESLSGAAFDRAYLEAMVKHHQHDIAQFERAAQSDNPQVRQLAERTLPVLRKHLEHAQRLQQEQGQQRRDR
jgi:putative membrane protein